MNRIAHTSRTTGSEYRAARQDKAQRLLNRIGSKVKHFKYLYMSYREFFRNWGRS